MNRYRIISENRKKGAHFLCVLKLPSYTPELLVYSSPNTSKRIPKVKKTSSQKSLYKSFVEDYHNLNRLPYPTERFSLASLALQDHQTWLVVSYKRLGLCVSSFNNIGWTEDSNKRAVGAVFIYKRGWLKCLLPQALLPRAHYVVHLKERILSINELVCETNVISFSLIKR